MQEKDKPLIYVPMRHPNTHPRKSIQNTLKIHRYLNNPTKRIFNSMSCSRKNRMTGKQLKNLIMSVYEENKKMQKAPRETPSPPPSSSLQM
jgi:hypothetical protein